MIIMLTLNPAKTNVETITPKQAGYLTEELDKEVVRLKYQLKNKLFSLTQQDEIRLFTNHYHYALTALLDQAMKNGKHAVFAKKDLKILQDKIVCCVDELLSFIEIRFATYLGLDERVPVTYLSVAKKELSAKLEQVKEQVTVSVGDKYLLNVVMDCVNGFITNNETQAVTFRDVLYHRELLKNIEQLEESDRLSTHYTLLEEMLIVMNFNHRSFITGFTQKMADRINIQADLKAKIDLLALCQKELKQFVPESDKGYHFQQPLLHTTLDNWFSQELFYLEKKLHLDIVPIGEQKSQDKRKTRKLNYKLVCTLSEDQIGIFFRAADDLRIIMSRSLSAIFNIIVPYLSTPYKEELSADSMRSHTYSIEERDKKIVIETLQNMIEKIKEY